VEAYNDLSHKGDVEGFLSYFHSDFSGWSINDALPRNKEQVRKGVTHRFPTRTTCLYAQNVERRVLRREETGAGESVELYDSPNEKVFMFATFAQIKKAMALVEEHTRRKLSIRRTRDSGFFTRCLLDFPDEHNGNIVGLTQKSIRWHRDGQAIERQKTLDSLGSDTKTALPPLHWPVRPEVKFLNTVGDIAEESEQMEHCVAAYAKNAVAGHCYLFHICKNDEHATVEVARTGRVIQSTGPKNKRNGAAEWGRSVTRSMGCQFSGNSGTVTNASLKSK